MKKALLLVLVVILIVVGAGYYYFNSNSNNGSSNIPSKNQTSINTIRVEPQYIMDASTAACRLAFNSSLIESSSSCTPTEVDKDFNLLYVTKDSQRMSFNQFLNEISQKLSNNDYKMVAFGESHLSNSEQATALEIIRNIETTRKISEFAVEQDSSAFTSTSGETGTKPIDIRGLQDGLTAMNIPITKGGSFKDEATFCSKAKASVDSLDNSEIAVSYTGSAHATLETQKYFFNDLLDSYAKTSYGIKECSAEGQDKSIAIVLIDLPKALSYAIQNKIINLDDNMVTAKQEIDSFSSKWKLATQDYSTPSEDFVIRDPTNEDVYFVFVNTDTYYTQGIHPELKGIKTVLDSSKSESILNNPRLFESCCTFQPVKIGEMITQDINSNLFPSPDYQSEPRYITYTDMSIDSGTGNKYEFEFDTALGKITKIHHFEWDVNSGKSLTDEFIS